MNGEHSKPELLASETMDCFWPRCSDHKRCEAHGSCVAKAQASGATFPQEAFTSNTMLTLLNEIKETRPGFDKALDVVRAQIDERDALRSALRAAMDDVPGWYDSARAALAGGVHETLQSYANRNVVEVYFDTHPNLDANQRITVRFFARWLDSRPAVETAAATPVHRICTAYESGFGDGFGALNKPNPYGITSDEAQAFDYGYDQGSKRRGAEPSEVLKPVVECTKCGRTFLTYEVGLDHVELCEHSAPNGKGEQTC